MNDRTDINEKLSHGNIAHLLRKMAIPGVISQILLLLYNMVGRIYLGRMNDGGTALLAVGLCLPITYIFNAAAFLFGQGGAARAMIKLGSGKRDEAEEFVEGGELCFCQGLLERNTESIKLIRELSRVNIALAAKSKRLEELTKILESAADEPNVAEIVDPYYIQVNSESAIEKVFRFTPFTAHHSLTGILLLSHSAICSSHRLIAPLTIPPEGLCGQADGSICCRLNYHLLLLFFSAIISLNV